MVTTFSRVFESESKEQQRQAEVVEAAGARIDFLVWIF